MGKRTDQHVAWHELAELLNRQAVVASLVRREWTGARLGQAVDLVKDALEVLKKSGRLSAGQVDAIRRLIASVVMMLGHQVGDRCDAHHTPAEGTSGRAEGGKGDG